MTHRIALVALIALAGCGRAAQEARTAAAPDAPYRARGNEPFWGLDIAADRTVFRTPGDSVVFPAATLVPAPGGRRYETSTAGLRLIAIIADSLCTDSMSGLPYPDRVRVSIGDRTYRGCGGDPADLLRGEAWVVATSSGREAAPTLAFGADGRLTGRSACNPYEARYTLTGEGVTISEVRLTSDETCAPARARQGAEFLEALRDVRRFEIPRGGALVLHTGDGRRLEAHR